MGLRRFVSRLLRSEVNREDPASHAVPTALITRSFRATVTDELSVRRGAVVRAMYREDDWIYVEAGDGRRGFIPVQYCTIRQRDDPRRERSVVGSNSDWNKSNLQRFIDNLPTRLGAATMIYPFQAVNLGDISLAANERLQVLNADDPNWLFVEDEHRARGFVPAVFVEWSGERANGRFCDKFMDQSLLVVEDFSPRSSLDLAVRAGDWVSGVFDENEAWLWARRDDRDGFVPMRCVVMATNL